MGENVECITSSVSELVSQVLSGSESGTKENIVQVTSSNTEDRITGHTTAELAAVTTSSTPVSQSVGLYGL